MVSVKSRKHRWIYWAPKLLLLLGRGSRVLKDGSVQLARVGADPRARLMSSWVEVLIGAISTIDEKRVKPRLTFDADHSKGPQGPGRLRTESRVHLFQEQDVSKIRGAHRFSPWEKAWSP